MSYLVMECHPAYAVVLDESGRFLKVANLNYEQGQTVSSVIALKPPRSRRHFGRWLVAAASMASSLLILLFLPSPIWEGANDNIAMALSFIAGTVLSAIAGKIGILVASLSNGRAAEAARVGIKPAFLIGFRGGAVMGLLVVGCALFGVSAVLMIVGADSGDADLDTDTDGDGAFDTHTDTGMSLFSMKGLTAFFAIGGWTGMLMLSYDIRVGISIAVSIAAGLAAYVIVWALIRLVLRLQEDGTMNYSTAVGQKATVYVSIPANRSGRGKVTLILQGRYTEADAVTDEAERIPVDREVTIVATAGDVFVVEQTKREADAQSKEE